MAFDGFFLLDGDNYDGSQLSWNANELNKVLECTDLRKIGGANKAADKVFFHS